MYSVFILYLEKSYVHKDSIQFKADILLHVWRNFCILIWNMFLLF